MLQETINCFQKEQSENLKKKQPDKKVKPKANKLKPIKEDGVYGGETKKAVEAFQRFANCEDDGIVGPITWKKLSQYCPYQIVDVVGLGHVDHKYVDRELRKLGSKPINPPFLSNALELIGKRVSLMAKIGKPIGLLRLYGHGNSGSQNLSKGLGGYWITPEIKRSHVNPCRHGRIMRIDKREACVYPSSGGQALALGKAKIDGDLEYHDLFQLTKQYLAPLRGCFGKFGSLEMHGCEIAKGESGKKLTALTALYLGVPVTAGRRRGGIKNTRELLRVEHPLRTWFPFGFDLATWINTRGIL